MAIVPAEMKPAKRRSDRRRGDAGTRELSDLDMRECLFTDYVGRVTDGHEPDGRGWTFVGCQWTKFAAPPRPSPPPGGAPTRSCAGSSRRAPGPIARCAAEAERLRLDARDLGLATRLAYGAVQRRATLDHVIAALAGRGLDRLEPAVVAALRLGTFQLAYLDRVPAHAAVGESVQLAKEDSRGGAGLVNAVLRRAAREARGLVEALPEDTPQAAALRHSHPEWVAALWWETLGPADALALMAADNEPAEPALRANTLRTTAAELAARLPVPSHGAPGLPEGLVLEAPFDAHGAPEWREGLFMPQSRAAMTVARVLDPRPGERVLDLCAAPAARRPTWPR